MIALRAINTYFSRIFLSKYEPRVKEIKACDVRAKPHARTHTSLETWQQVIYLDSKYVRYEEEKAT